MNQTQTLEFANNKYFSSLYDKGAVIRRAWCHFMNKRYLTKFGARHSVMNFECKNEIILNYNIRKIGFMNYQVEIL